MVMFVQLSPVITFQWSLTVMGMKKKSENLQRITHSLLSDSSEGFSISGEKIVCLQSSFL